MALLPPEVKLASIPSRSSAWWPDHTTELTRTEPRGRPPSPRGSEFPFSHRTPVGPRPRPRQHGSVWKRKAHVARTGSIEPNRVERSVPRPHGERTGDVAGGDVVGAWPSRGGADVWCSGTASGLDGRCSTRRRDDGEGSQGVQWDNSKQNRLTSLLALTVTQNLHQSKRNGRFVTQMAPVWPGVSTHLTPRLLSSAMLGTALLRAFRTAGNRASSHLVYHGVGVENEGRGPTSLPSPTYANLVNPWKNPRDAVHG